MRTPTNVPIEIGLFAELDPNDAGRLFAAGTLASFEVDEIVIQQGDPQSSLHLVLGGSLRVRCDSPYSVVELGLLGPGDCFGEMSILDPLKASATVKALECGDLWSIERKSYQGFLRDHPRAGIQLITYLGVQLTRRLRKFEDQMLRYCQRPVGFDYDY